MVILLRLALLGTIKADKSECPEDCTSNIYSSELTSAHMSEVSSLNLIIGKNTLLIGYIYSYIRLYKLETIFLQQVDLKSALDSEDF